jgi:hypothetical protein
LGAEEASIGARILIGRCTMYYGRSTTYGDVRERGRAKALCVSGGAGRRMTLSMYGASDGLMSGH